MASKERVLSMRVRNLIGNGPRAEFKRGLGLVARCFREFSGEALESVSLKMLLKRLAVLPRQSRLHQQWGYRPAEQLESRVLLADPTIHIESQHNGDYYSIRVRDLGPNAVIGTADNPDDPSDIQSLYYQDDDHPNRIWQHRFDDTGTTGTFELSTNRRPLYFTEFHGNNSPITFGDFRTFGKSFYVLQGHSQLASISNPPIVIEQPKFSLGGSPGGMSLKSENNYFGEPSTGNHTIRITGTIDTTDPQGESGNIGVFSSTTVEVCGGTLRGADITLATWVNNNVLSLGFESKTPTVRICENAVIDGHDVSITAAKSLRDFKRQMFGFDNSTSAVEVTDSTIAASGSLHVGSDTEDTIGLFDGEYNYLIGMLGYNAFFTYFSQENFKVKEVPVLPALRSLLNAVGVMHRHAEAQVKVQGSTLTAVGNIDISSIATAVSSINSITSTNLLGKATSKLPASMGWLKDTFFAASWAHSNSEATLDILDSTISSTAGNINIGSAGKSTANATSRALAGYRPTNNANTYQSNEATNTITFALSTGKLNSKTTVDSGSIIQAAGTAAIVALGNSSTNPTTTSRSYGDGTLAVSFSLGFDESNVITTVEGDVSAGALQLSDNQTTLRVPTAGDFSDLTLFPIDDSSIDAGEWVRYLLSEGELPNRVDGYASLEDDGLYYVVDAVTDPQTLQKSVQLSTIPALDIALPSGPDGSPIPISSNQSLEFSVTLPIDAALDPDNPGRVAGNVQPGNGYFYSPGYQLTDGQQVKYQYQKRDAESQPVSGLTANAVYYAIRYDDNFFQLATSVANAAARIAIPVSLSGDLVGNILSWSEFIPFDPASQNYDDQLRIRSNGRLRVDAGRLAGVVTGSPVVYHVDSNVSRLNAAPISFSADPVTSLEFDPIAESALNVKVYDSVNSLWVFPNHGLSTGTPLVYRTGPRSTPLQLVDRTFDAEGDPVAIPEGTTLYAIVIDNSRIRWATSPANAASHVAVEQTLISDSGTYTLTTPTNQTIAFDPMAQVVVPHVDLIQDTIRLEDGGALATGQRVTYTAGRDNIAVGGLRDGADYYVILQGDYAVQLADSWEHALQGLAIDLTHPGTMENPGQSAHKFQAWGVDPIHDWIVTPGHSLETGQAVQFQQGSGPAIGLVDGETYFVIRVDADMFRLASSREAALAAGPVGFSATTPLQAVALLRVSADAPVQPVGFVSPNVVQVLDPSLAVSMVDLTADTLALGTGWDLGQKVVYGAGGGTPIGGLTDQTPYFVIPQAGGKIKLAATLSDAQVGTPIDLTSLGTLGLSGHYIRIVPEFELAGDTQDVLTFSPLLGPPIDTSSDRMKIPRHGYAEGQVVTYLAGNGTPIGGLASGVDYYIRNPDTDSFQFSLTANGQILDLKPGATGDRHGLEIPRTVRSGDSHLVGLTPGQKYFAVVDGISNGRLELRLATSVIDAGMASLIHADLSGRTAGASFGELLDTGESDAALKVASQLNAVNSATAYPNIGGNPAFWELLSYPEYASNSFLNKNQGGQRGNVWRAAGQATMGNNVEFQASSQKEHSSLAAAVAVVVTDHTVQTIISPGAKLQTLGDLKLTATVAQGGFVQCWGGIVANKNTNWAWSPAVAVVSHRNVAQVLIGLDQNQQIPDGNLVTLDAGKTLSLQADVNYDRLANWNQYLQWLKLFGVGGDAGSAWESIGKGLRGADQSYIATALSTFGLSNFLNVWVNCTNYATHEGAGRDDSAGVSVALSLAETIYQNTSEVTIGNALINQNPDYATPEQSVELDAGTTMTIISLSGMINFDLGLFKVVNGLGNNGGLSFIGTWWEENSNFRGSASKEGGFGLGQMLVVTTNQTIARIVGTTRIATGLRGHLRVNATETGKRTILAQSGAKAMSPASAIGAGAGSVGVVVGESDTLAHIDRGVSVTGRQNLSRAGDVLLSATNTTQTVCGTGATALSEGKAGVGASLGLVFQTRHTGAFLGDIDQSFPADLAPTFASASRPQPGKLQINSLELNSGNHGWTWNVSVVGAFATGAPRKVERVEQEEVNGNELVDQRAGNENDNNRRVSLHEGGPQLEENQPPEEVQPGQGENGWLKAWKKKTEGLKFRKLGVKSANKPAEKKQTSAGLAGDFAFTDINDNTSSLLATGAFTEVIIVGDGRTDSALKLSTTNPTRAVTVGGAAALALPNEGNGSTRSVAVAGSVALNNITMTTTARVTGDTGMAPMQIGGAVFVEAISGASDQTEEYFYAVAASVGIAHAKGAYSFGGAFSVAATIFGGETRAQLQQANCSGLDGKAAGHLTVRASNQHKLSSDGGAFAVSGDSGVGESGGRSLGFGVMAAWNTYLSSVLATIDDSDLQVQGITVDSSDSSKFQTIALAGAVVIGHPIFSLSGSFAWNTIHRDVQSLITGGCTIVIPADGFAAGSDPTRDITVRASDSLQISAFSLAVAVDVAKSLKEVAFTAAIGASMSYNTVNSRDKGVIAAIDADRIDAPRSNLKVNALSSPTCEAFAMPIGLLVSPDKVGFTVAAALAVNSLDGRIESRVSPVQISCFDLTVTSDYSPNVTAEIVDVSVSVQWSEQFNVNVTVGFCYAYNQDLTQVIALLEGDQNSTQQALIDATGQVVVSTKLAGQADSKPTWKASTAGVAFNFSAGNSAGWSIGFIGTFSYNNVRPIVATKVSNVSIPDATTVSVLAEQASYAEVNALGVGIGFSGSSGGFGVTLSPILQFAINYEVGAVSATIDRSLIACSGELYVNAERNSSLIATALAVQIGVSLGSTAAITVGGVFTVVANNPNHTSGNSGSWTAGSVKTSISDSDIQAGRADVRAIATPAYRTEVLQAEINAAASANFALTISVGVVHSVNNLYDSVDASVSGTILTATIGAIAVTATLERPDDGNPVSDEFNLDASLRSYSFSGVLATYGGAVSVVGCYSEITTAANIHAEVLNSSLDAQTGVSVLAEDHTTAHSHWTDLQITASVALGGAITLAFPTMQTNLGNTVVAVIQVTNDQSNPAVVSTNSGDVIVRADSLARSAQVVGNKLITAGLVVVSISKPNLNTYFTSNVTALVSGASHNGSLSVQAPAGHILVNSRYLGTGQGALSSEADDLGVAIGIGALVDYVFNTVTASPILTASITGGVTATALNQIQIQATGDGRIAADSKQWVGALIGGSSAAGFLSTDVKPTLIAAAGTSASGRTDLRAGKIEVKAESLIDGVSQSTLASYGFLTATTVRSESTSSVTPSMAVNIGSNAQLFAESEIALNATGGKDIVPPPRDFNTNDVDVELNTIDFKQFINLNDNDRMKYDVGVDSSGNSQAPIGGLSDQTVYHVFPVSGSAIKLGEEFDARIVNPGTDRLGFSEATAFKGPFPLNSWSQHHWDKVIYEVPYGSADAVGGLTPGKTYFVNKISDTVVSLIDPDHIPEAPHAIDNSYFSTTDGVTTFSIPNHGFEDGQIVSYVAPTPVTIGSSQVGTSTALKIDAEELAAEPIAETNDYAIFVGDSIDQFLDGASYRYTAGESLGQWYWSETDEQKKWTVVGAKGTFWDTSEDSAPNNAWTNWADGSPLSPSDGGGTALQIDSAGVWSNPAGGTRLSYYVLEQPVFVYKSKQDIDEMGWDELQKYGNDNQLWLPSIIRSAELIDLRQIMSDNSLHYAFLGGSDSGHKNHWVWDTSSRDQNNDVSFWHGLNDGYNTGDFATPWAISEPNDGSQKAKDRIINREEALVAYRSDGGQITWNDDKKHYQSLNSAGGYVFERMRYSLQALPAGGGTVFDAMTDAKSKGGWLATIGSEDDNTAIVQLFEDHDVSDPAWLGGRLQTGITALKDGTSYTVEVLSDQVTNNFGVSGFSDLPYGLPWSDGQPNSSNTDADYLAMNAADGTWKAVSDSEKHAYVLYIPAASDSSASYQLQNASFTFADAIRDATQRGGYVAFPRTSTEKQSILDQFRGITADIWLNASDSASEGVWRYFDASKPAHSQSIRLWDSSNKLVPVAQPEGGTFTFNLSPTSQQKIEGLEDGKTYIVQRVDAHRFGLQQKSSDGQLLPVTLPNPADLAGGKGSYIGTLGVDLTSAGRGDHRLIFDLTAPQANLTQHLDFQSAGVGEESVGSGKATAIGTGSTGSAFAFSNIKTFAYSKPATAITLDEGAGLRVFGADGQIAIRSTAYGNANSSAYAAAGGLSASAKSDAEIQLAQRSEISIQGTLEASVIEIEAQAGGYALNRSNSKTGGALAYSRADSRVSERFHTAVQIGSSDESSTRLTAGNELTVRSRLVELKIDLGTLANSGGLIGHAESNWSGSTQDIVAIDMCPDENWSNLAEVIVRNARLEVADSEGMLNVNASIAGVDATANVKSQAKLLAPNRANAMVVGDLDARVDVGDSSLLRASMITVSAFQTSQNWKADAEIRKQGRSSSQAKAGVKNTGDVRIVAAENAQFMTRYLRVDALQFQTRYFNGEMSNSPESASSFVSHSSSLKNKDKTDNLTAETSLDLNDSDPIDWAAPVFGIGLASLKIIENGTEDRSFSRGTVSYSMNSELVTITGVSSYDSSLQVDFGWTNATTLPQMSAMLQSDKQGSVNSKIVTASTPTLNAAITPMVTVVNLSNRHLTINHLDLRSPAGSATVKFILNGVTTTQSAVMTGRYSRLVIDNQAADRDILLDYLSAREIELSSTRDITKSASVTVGRLVGSRFVLDAGRVLGNAVTAVPAAPVILLSSASNDDPPALVEAVAGEDLSLQVVFAPGSEGKVVPLQKFAAQQLDVRLLPWGPSSREQTTNYFVQIEALPSTILNRIVSVYGNTEPNLNRNNSIDLSGAQVGIDASVIYSAQPNEPQILIQTTGDNAVSVVPTGSATSHVRRITSSFGSIALSSTGDLLIDELVSTKQTVSWTGSGALRGAQSSTPVIQANTLRLASGGGVGTATASLSTQVTWLVGTPGLESGAVYLLNSDAGAGLRLDAVTVGTGPLQVVTSGSLTVDGPVAATGGGNISLVANGVAPDYQYVAGTWTYSEAQADALARNGGLAAARRDAQNRLFSDLLARSPMNPQAAWLGGMLDAGTQQVSWKLPDGSIVPFHTLPIATKFDAAFTPVTLPPVSFWSDNQLLPNRYANWALNEPNTGSSSLNLNHAVMNSDGSWFAGNREGKRFYVLNIPERGSYTLIHDKLRTFSEAVFDARDRGGFVARVADATEQTAVQSAMQSGGQGISVWLNMTDEGHEGDWQYAGLPAQFFYTNWSMSQPGFTRGGWSNWAQGEPNDWNGSEDNAVMNADGSWNDVSGTSKYAYVLYLRGAYTLMSTPLTFAEAKADASRKGGFVASVMTYDDQISISNAANGTPVWINNTDIVREREWLALDYTTNTYGTFSNWASSEPNNYLGSENYVVMVPSGRWNDVAGTETHGYVLYLPSSGTYSYQAGQFTFSAALRDASAKGGYVAHITSSAEQQTVALASGIKPVGWSNWAANEPNNANGDEDNAVMNADGRWVDVPGTQTFGYVLFSSAGYSYQSGKFTFSQAQADAKSKGGFVASVITYLDQQEVARAANGNKVWINNTDVANEGEWLAFDYGAETYSFYSNWAASEPNNFGGSENNAVMTASGRWNDVSETSRYAYVLYLPSTGAYSYQPGPFTFNEAVSHATGLKGFVAAVTNAAQQQAVRTAANGNVVWLNITDMGQEGDWRGTNTVWLNATDDGTEGRWRVGTYGRELNGTILYWDGTWREESRFQKHGYVLYKPQDNSYSIQSTPLTLAEARSDAKTRGGIIARITTQAEQDLIRELNPGVIWINVTDEMSEGTWQVASDGSAVDGMAYRNWGSQQPNYSALPDQTRRDNIVMQADGTWATEGAGFRHPYVLFTPSTGHYSLQTGESGSGFTFLDAQSDAFRHGGYVATVTNKSDLDSVLGAAVGKTVWLNGWNDGHGYWRMLSAYPKATPETFVRWAENFGWRHPRDWSNGDARGVLLQQDGQTWALRNTTTTSGYILQTRQQASIYVNSTVNATGGDGNINLIGIGDIVLGGPGSSSPATVSTSALGQIAVGPGTRYVDGQVRNGDGQAKLSMAPTSRITSDLGTIALLATGSIELSQVVTGGSALIVADYNGVESGLPDGSGAITGTNNDSNAGVHVTAARAIFAAEGAVNEAGVGHRSKPILTHVGTVAATTDKGDLSIQNQGPLVLGSVDVKLTGLLSRVLKWTDVAPVTQLPAWMSEWFRHRQEIAPLIATPDGHFVMGGAAILDQDNAGIATGTLSVEARDGDLVVQNDVPVVNLDAGLLRLAALSASLPARLVMPNSTRLYTEGGNGSLVLEEGSPGDPQAVAVPEGTCDFYHWLDIRGELTQGQDLWLEASGCPETAPPSMLRASFAPVTMLGAANVSQPLFLFSTNRAVRDSSTLSEAGEPNVGSIDTRRAGTHVVFLRVFDQEGRYNDYQRTVTIADQLPTALRAISGVAVAGQLETFRWQFDDPGTDDLHRASISWGDGSPDTVIELPVGERTVTATHRFENSGRRDIRASLVDVASGTPLNWLGTQMVSAVTFVGGQLRIQGSDMPDSLQLSVQGRSLLVDIRWAERPVVREVFSLSKMRSIRFEGEGGDDLLQTSDAVKIPVQAMGGDGADHLIGGGGRDTLEGNSGDDTLDGAAGDDVYLFATDNQLGIDTVLEAYGGGVDTLDFSDTTTLSLVVNLGLLTQQTVNNHLSLILGSDSTVENVTGGDLNDTFTGNSLNNTFRGGDGDDVYQFNTDSFLGIDTIDDFDGIDTLDFSASATLGVKVDLGRKIKQKINKNLKLKLTRRLSIENLNGGASNDILIGNNRDNVLNGGAGDDVLRGGRGDDRLEGGTGNDKLYGGIGDDVLKGDAGDDRLRGDAGNDIFLFDTDTGLGRDTVRDSGGKDLLDFSQTSTQNIQLSLNKTAEQSVNSNLSLRLPATIEHVVGGSMGNHLIGNRLANILVGGQSRDFLSGLGGRDILIGGSGSDELIGSLKGAVIIPGQVKWQNETTGQIDYPDLLAVSHEWARRTLTRNQRIRNLQQGVGLGREIRLDSSSVLGDSSMIDEVSGNNLLDWIFLNPEDVLK